MRYPKDAPIPEGPFEETIKQITPNQWLLGPSLLCTRHISHEDNIEYDWKDEGDGSCYSVQFIDGDNIPAGTAPDSQCPIKCIKPHWNCNVWKIGQSAFLKACHLPAEMETEAVTIEFVRQNFPTVPVPRVIQHYRDEESWISYTLLEKMPGEVLNTAWKNLSEADREGIISQMVEIIKTLATLTRDTIVTPTGKRVFEPYLIRRGTESMSRTYDSLELYLRDSFVPDLLDPNCGKKLEEIWGKSSTPNEFVLYHSDLGPTNIMVEQKEGKTVVSGVLDWLGVGFLPREFVATKPLLSPGHDFEWDDDSDEESKREYRTLLGYALHKEDGFEAFGQEWLAWRNGKQ